jgi:uncharacterized protein YecT (DUF1311 family)
MWRRKIVFKNTLWALILAWPSSVSGAFAGTEGFQCSEAKTQVEMNDCASEEFKKEDAELNRVYQEILKKYKDDPVFIKKLREAQQAWLKFRDAQFEARFPHILDSRGQYNYGTVFPMCSSLYKAELTHARTEDLRLWLDGIQEGDVCSGSLPIKE